MDATLIIHYRQSQLKHASHINIFVMLLMLFVVSGHCSAAMAMGASLASAEPQLVEPISSGHSGHCDSSNSSSDSDHTSQEGHGCWDNHCPESATSLQFQSFKQVKDKQDDAKPLVAALNPLPPSRAGPCGRATALPSTDFITPPLFYTLCVLRL